MLPTPSRPRARGRIRLTLRERKAVSNRYEGMKDWTLRKGNLHVHSTRSDGGKTYEELVDLLGLIVEFSS